MIRSTKLSRATLYAAVAIVVTGLIADAMPDNIVCLKATAPALPTLGQRVSVVIPAEGTPLAPAGLYEVTDIAQTITLRKLTVDGKRHNKTAKPVDVSLAGWPIYVNSGTLKLAA